MKETRKEKLEALLERAKTKKAPAQPLWSIIYEQLSNIEMVKDKGTTYAMMANEMGVTPRTFSAALKKARAKRHEETKVSEIQTKNEETEAEIVIPPPLTTKRTFNV